MMLATIAVMAACSFFVPIIYLEIRYYREHKVLMKITKCDEDNDIDAMELILNSKEAKYLSKEVIHTHREYIRIYRKYASKA